MNPYRLTLRAILRNDKQEVLMMRRPEGAKHFPGYWELPGGKVNDGEHFMDGLIREIYEETGFHVEPKGLAGSAEYAYADYTVTYIFFHVKIVGGEFAISEEHDDFTWMGLDALKAIEVPPQLRGVIDSIT